MAFEENKAAIAARIKYLIQRSGLSQAQFARRLGIDPANMSKHLSGRLPITAGLVNRISVDLCVDKEWLLTGEGVPYAKHRSFEATSVPVYDVDVTAGTSELSRLFTEDRIVGTIAMPAISPECVVVHVSGQSMSPEINHGAYIAIRPYSDLSNILWGKIYVVVLDDHRMVKYMQRHSSDPTKAVLHSVNPSYADVEISLADIRKLYSVDAVMNFDR